MLITTKTGNLSSFDIGTRVVDAVLFEWYETAKRVQRKRSNKGIDLSLKFLQQPPDFREGDILNLDDDSVIIVEIVPCDSLIIFPADSFELASICYEIGNKHLPLFYDEGSLLVPYEKPLHRLLEAQGFRTERAERKLLKPLKTTVAPHTDSNSPSLFSRIMQLTTGEK